MLCLGLDVGSTTVKGAVLDLDRGEVRSILKEPFPAPLAGLPAGYCEISPAEIVAVVSSLISRLLQVAPDARSLFCSGQMGGLILVDQNGRALTNYLSWRDQRTLQSPTAAGTLLDAIKSTWRGEEFRELGQELQPGSASSLLYWLARHDRLPADALPATVADYVLGQLCGELPSMDPTHAIGLLDLRAGTWHRGAFDALGLEQVHWPQLADQRTPLGDFTMAGQQVRCYPSFGDQQCALRGVGLTRDELSLNVSTGSQVSRRTGQFEPGPYQTRKYFHGDYLNTITHLPAGRSLNVLFELLTELARAEGVTLSHPWETIAQQAAQSDGGGLRVDLAFFAGPLGAQGHIQGLTTENLTIGNLFHASFRSMADNYALCAGRVCPELNVASIAVSGGLTRSVPVLKQLIQERFAMPIRESTEAEETLVGLLEIARDLETWR